MKKFLFLIATVFILHAEEDKEPIDVDPYENLNRVVFNISDSLDENFLRPTAQIYSNYTPLFIKDSVTNFFYNLAEIDTVINQLLQGKPKLAAEDSLRFVINTTIGVGGIFDVATRMGFERHDEDFGQTLGFWGVPDGPYLVLPFLGPSSFRDGPSMIVDYELSPVEQLHHEERQILQTLDIVDTRARLLRATKILDTAAKDKYIFIRESYLQKRESQVNDGNVKEEFEIDVHSVDY